MDRGRMDALVTATQGRLKRSWLAMLAHLREENSEAAIAERIRTGHTSADYLPVIGIEDAGKRAAIGWHTAYIAAGQATARWLDRQLRAPSEVSKKLPVFDPNATPAVAWAEANDLRLIREIENETRALLHQILLDGARNGTNPLEMAREMRGSLGLTAYQRGIVENYRRQLETGQFSAALRRELSSGHSDRAIANALANQRQLSKAQIDVAVDRYRQNWIKMRASTIARTEGLRVAHQGSDELYRQAITRGDLTAEELEQEWHHAGHAATSARVGRTKGKGKGRGGPRPFHVSMDGQTRAFGEPFASGIGGELRYPGDPQASAEETLNCKCVKTTRVVGGAGAGRGGFPRGGAAAEETVAADEAVLEEEALAIEEEAAAAEQAALEAEFADDVGVAEDAGAAVDLGDLEFVGPEADELLQAIVNETDLGGGVNQSRLVTFEDGTSAVWKPAAGESAFDRQPGIPAGTMHLREQAAYRMAMDMELDVVPPTVSRSYNGEAGSAQRFVRARPAWNARTIDQDSAEQMRLLDFIAGNRDRHVGNVLLQRGGKIVAIDNGQAFPTIRAGIQQPGNTLLPFIGDGLTEATRARIAALDLRSLASGLRRDGVDDEAIRHVLFRASVLKSDPDLLAVPETVHVAGRPYRFADMTRERQEHYLNDISLTAEQRVTAVARAEIDEIMRSL